MEVLCKNIFVGDGGAAVLLAGALGGGGGEFYLALETSAFFVFPIPLSFSNFILFFNFFLLGDFFETTFGVGGPAAVTRSNVIVGWDF